MSDKTKIDAAQMYSDITAIENTIRDAYDSLHDFAHFYKTHESIEQLSESAAEELVKYKDKHICPIHDICVAAYEAMDTD